MVQKLADKDLDREIARLLDDSGRRRRSRRDNGPVTRKIGPAGAKGRPPNGFAKKLLYANAVFVRVRSGVPFSRAVAEVAEKYRKTKHRIYASVKTIEQTDPREYLWEYDPIEPWD